MIKTTKNIYPKIWNYENLYEAWRKAARGKRKAIAVADFEYHLIDNLLNLEEELKTQSYKPGPYYHFRLNYPKKRLISAAPFRDRVVHHALINQIEGIFEARFCSDSYACRVGKGTHKALARCQEFSRHYPYILQCDIVQFFPAIDHHLLKQILFQHIADSKTKWLITLILDGGAGVLKDEYNIVYFEGDDLEAANRPRGLPIGNLSSQFWANCYLNQLDQYIKRGLKCRAYLRYMDDFLLFSASKKQLWQWKKAIMAFLPSLRLTLHIHSSTVYPVSNGIPFLGFVTYPSHRLLKRRNKIAFSRRVKHQIQQLNQGILSHNDVEASMKGWLAHAKHGSTHRLRQALVNQYPIPGSQK